MNSVHKSMHDSQVEQGAHGGHAHIAPNAHGGHSANQDEGVKLMRRLGMLHQHGLLGPWMSNYRNTRFIPVSNTVFGAALAALLIGAALAYLLPQNLKLI